jgi:hypothetical protein
MTQIYISPSEIRTDLDTQSRIELNDNTVQEYAEAMQEGQKFPPLLVFKDETEEEYILADGFHRLAAHLQVLPDEPIEVIVREGTLEDARWESIGANKSHGLRRTNEDKRNAVTQALKHPKGAELSNVKIAEHVGVTDKTVAAVRKDLESTSEIPRSTNRLGQDGRVINTENIGTKKSSPPDGATCDECKFFQGGTCVETDADPLPWTDACDTFDPIEQQEIEGESDEESAEIPEKPAPKTRGKSLHQNRNLKDCKLVYLPDDNTQLFAVELRNSFKEGYLRECIEALTHILNDNDD